MSEVTVPDLGDYADVPVIEVLVGAGDAVRAEDPLIVIESDKATMEIPAPSAGTVEKLLVAVGDTVSAGTAIATLADGGGGEVGPIEGAGAISAEPDDRAPGEEVVARGETSDDTPAADDDAVDVVVIGSGPGGYTAAFRAADLGLEVVLVERDPVLGGVCLNVGCIPSKALLHAARVIAESEEAREFGIRFSEPEIELARLAEWKRDVVGTLTDGLVGLAKRRSVRVVTGEARFTSPHAVAVGDEEIRFRHAIIAVGSRPVALPDLPEDERIIDSTGALELVDVPERLLVIGGGIIGLEMACVYDGLGSEVTVVELTDQLVPGCDPDLVKVLQKRISDRYAAIHLGTRVTSLSLGEDDITAGFDGPDAPESGVYDRVLVAVGRRPNGDLLEVGPAGIEVDEKGFITVDDQMRTNVGHIHAIGDVVGHPMLAHKATHEASVAAEVIAGRDVAFDARSIPSVAYTDPEIAWTGLTETDAGDTEYETAKFPWAASGRALALGRSAGLTKLLVDPGTRRILGAGIAGPNAGDLIAEVALAIEMGANAEDIALTIHPHPTLSETVAFAAEAAEGVITDLYLPKRR